MSSSEAVTAAASRKSSDQKGSDRRTGSSKDQSVEEVQRIKDLVSKVGSLEFRILANGRTSKGNEDAKKLIRGGQQSERSTGH